MSDAHGFGTCTGCNGDIALNGYMVTVNEGYFCKPSCHQIWASKEIHSLQTKLEDAERKLAEFVWLEGTEDGRLYGQQVQALVEAIEKFLPRIISAGTSERLVAVKEALAPFQQEPEQREGEDA